MNDGLETRRWNGTKSAFADYAAAPVRAAGNRANVAAECESPALRRNGEDESAKADFVLL
jgi:hypothetical protein